MKNNKFTSILMAFVICAVQNVAAQTASAAAADAEIAIVEGFALDDYGRRTQDLSKLPKMERDIEILKNVLNDLFNGGRDMFGSSSNEGIYIPGRGVIFNMTNISTRGYGNVVFAETITIDLDDDSSKEDSDEKSKEEVNNENRKELEEKSKQFLLNYGSLLSELKPNEKVMLNIDFNEFRIVKKDQSSQQNGALYLYGSRSNMKRMISSIGYSDIDAYMDGKLDESAAESKVEVNIIDKNENEKRDVKIFAGIMDDLFNSMSDGKFKRRGRTSYSYFEGFGLMYNLKFSSNTSRNVVFATADGAIIETDNNLEENKKREEYYKAVEEAFPDFERQLKQNILEYGRTLRSVKDDEVIIVNVDMGSTYRKTKIPRSLQMIIPKKLINEYARGSKSLEKAADEIDVKKLKAAISSGSSTYYPTNDLFESAIQVSGYSQSQGQN